MAIKLSGSAQLYSSTVNVPNASGADFTVLLWYCPTSVVGTQNIFFIGPNTNSSALWVEHTGGTVDLGGQANFNGGTSLTANTWFRIAVVVSGTTASLYIAGTTGGIGTPTTGTWADVPTVTQLRIGANATPGEYSSGAFANFKQYNAALTAAEIELELSQYLPLRTLNLLRWHSFVVPDTVDYSGNASTLTATGTPTRHTTDPPIRWSRSRSPRIGISSTPILGIDSGTLTEEPSTLFVDGTASESGSLNDATPSIAVTTAASESFSLGETASILITSTRTDSNFFSEQPVSSQLVWNLADSSTLTEAHTEAVTTAAADSGTFTDSPGVVLQLTALTANDSLALTDSSVVDKTELRFPTETFTLSESAVSVQFADQQVTESFGLTETATVAVVTTASDSFGLIIENKSITAVITTDEFATLNEFVTQLITSLVADDDFGIFIEDGQVDYKDIPEWIYATIGTANTLIVDVDTANHLQSVLDAPNTIRTNISTKFWYSDIETEGRSGDTEVPATHGGDVDSKTYYASILEP